MRNDARLAFSTSVTTRGQREGEIDGEAYHFLSEQEFFERRDNGDLLEWAQVFGNYYGTSRLALEESQAEGRDLILDIDVQGAAQLKDKLPEAITVFILPPSREELEARLRKRSSDSDAVIERRLREAAGEARNYRSYDYVLVNDQVDESFERLRGIVLAERCRKHRVEAEIRPILEGFESEARG